MKHGRREREERESTEGWGEGRERGGRDGGERDGGGERGRGIEAEREIGEEVLKQREGEGKRH